MRVARLGRRELGAGSRALMIVLACALGACGKKGPPLTPFVLGVALLITVRQIRGQDIAVSPVPVRHRASSQ